MIKLDKLNAIYIIYLQNKPVNALSIELVYEFSKLLDEIIEEDFCRGLIITTSLSHFCAGADLKERAGMNKESSIDAVYSIKNLVDKIDNLPFVTIANIRGICIGGGLEMALGCDFRYCTDNAVFGFPECSLGIIPGAGGTQRLPRLIGISNAKHMIYLADQGRVTAVIALEYGLVDKIVSDGLESSIELLKSISKNSNHSISLSKRCINKGFNLPLKDALNFEFKEYIKTLEFSDRKKALKKYIKD